MYKRQRSIRDTIAQAFSCHPAQLEAVEFGGEAVEAGATYEDYGVEVGQSSFVCPGLACVAGLAQYSAERMCMCW